MATGLCLPGSPPPLVCPRRCKKNGPSRFLTSTQCLCAFAAMDGETCIAPRTESSPHIVRILALFFFSWPWGFSGTKPCMPQRGGASWSSGPLTSVTPALADAQSCLELPYWDAYCSSLRTVCNDCPRQLPRVLPFFWVQCNALPGLFRCRPSSSQWHGKPLLSFEMRSNLQIERQAWTRTFLRATQRPSDPCWHRRD